MLIGVGALTPVIVMLLEVVAVLIAALATAVNVPTLASGVVSAAAPLVVAVKPAVRVPTVRFVDDAVPGAVAVVTRTHTVWLFVIVPLLEVKLASSTGVLAVQPIR